MLGWQLMPEVCRSKAEENRAKCWVDNLCPQFAEGTTSPKCQTMECLHSNWMTYGRSLPKDILPIACKQSSVRLCAFLTKWGKSFILILNPRQLTADTPLQRETKGMVFKAIFYTHEWKRSFFLKQWFLILNFCQRHYKLFFNLIKKFYTERFVIFVWFIFFAFI